MVKTSFILLLLFITTYTTNAQDKFEHNYLGEEFQLYKGATFKLKENVISGMTYAFYADIWDCKTNYNSNVLYPDSKYKFKSVADSLKGRLFLVENIVDKNGDTWNNSEHNDYFEAPILVIKDQSNGNVIYYKYDKRYEHNFPFDVLRLKYPEDYFCSKISKEIDEFTNEIKYNSPIMDGTFISSAIIYRTESKGKKHYYLRLKAYGSTVSINQNSIIVLFQDGSKWNKASPIDVEASEYGFIYSAFITLNKADLDFFSTKNIKKFRLYVYDEDITLGTSEKFKNYVKCIISK